MLVPRVAQGTRTSAWRRGWAPALRQPACRRPARCAAARAAPCPPAYPTALSAPAVERAFTSSLRDFNYMMCNTASSWFPSRSDGRQATTSACQGQALGYSRERLQWLVSCQFHYCSRAAQSRSSACVGVRACVVKQGVQARGGTQLQPHPSTHAAGCRHIAPAPARA